MTYLTQALCLISKTTTLKKSRFFLDFDMDHRRYNHFPQGHYERI